jgi:glycosyltransferase involved in cell wall biosynthesis
MSDSDQYKNHKKLYHIFPAGNGNNVLYINAIKKTLDPYFKQTVFVSASSPVKGKGYKLWFHPITDLFRTDNKNRILSISRYGLRYIEFFSCLFMIWLKCLFERPHYLNLSTATLLKLEYYFIKAIKALGVKPIYTIHDAQPFEVGYKRMSAKKLERFYLLFDHIIVHNDLSRNFAVDQFKLKQVAFIQFPFPPMDLKELKNAAEVATGSGRKFLFIGAFKKEKGYDDLINAWKLIDENILKNTEHTLILAGAIPQGVDSLIDSNTSTANMQVLNKYLTDDEFIHYIANADVVVLPYRAGTNSGVLSTVMSLGKLVICSDIPSLKSHSLVLEENIFPAGNTVALKNKLVEYINYSAPEIQHLKADALKRFERYKNSFQQETVSAFNPLINQ